MPRSPRPLHLLYRGLIASSAIMALLVAATLWFGAKADSGDKLVDHAIMVRAQITEIIDLVQTGESSQRGYLLTGLDAYLKPFEHAAATLPQALDKADRLVASHPREREMMATLRQLITAKLAALRHTIDESGSARITVAVRITGQDRRLMDQILQLGSAIEKADEQHLKIYEASLATDRMLLESGTGASLLLICAIGVLVSFFTRRSFTNLAAAYDQLAVTNEALLQQTQQRESAESQLRQVQKMEAIGQLTGGIAHDFNNMLSVIAGSLELIKRRLKRGDFAIDGYVAAAAKATRRSAALTHRLLAFARKQPLSPEVLEPNRMIGSMSDLLHSTLGAQVQIETVLAAGSWKTNTDANQLESAVLNLALNAHHAMPDGGKLTIETANAFLDDAYCKQHPEVAAGQYVLIAISDTGTGMPPEVAARAFEPFFTTKPSGAGTGLGLSQVYGFVKQSRGHIKIYSEVGSGTTVKIYLPRFVGEGDKRSAITSAPPNGTTNEVILVVEDDPLVRRLTIEAVRELGYTALESENTAQALTILGDRSDVTLLFTDVVMPDVNGKKLADQAVALYPGLKLLFTTGYTANAVVHGGVLGAGVKLLSKPYTIEQLAEKIHSVLDK